MYNQESVDIRAEIRADFVKRLFSVAVGLGFAAKLVDMQWMQEGSFPTAAERHQILVLILGLFITVLSWDGYLMSIHSKPLKRPGRYYIDICLVFLYLIFLISSGIPHFFPVILTAIFGLYVFWDVLTVMEYPNKYTNYTNIKTRVIYINAFRNKAGYYQGPIISITWLFYFASLMNIDLFLHFVPSWVLAVHALGGLCIYRIEKQYSTLEKSFLGSGQRFVVGALLILSTFSVSGGIRL